MTYRKNETALGTYRASTSIAEPVRDTKTGKVTGYEAVHHPGALPFAAYDKSGTAWRVTEAEAAAIDARRAK